ncbi:MAG: hypothetical protein WBN92_20605 [Terriglobia bacterium]
MAATANQVTRESRGDELPPVLKQDPLRFRRRNLKDKRLRALFQTAAKTASWGEAKKSVGRGFGMGGGFEKGGDVIFDATGIRLGSLMA